jgi:diguanylate cyclase (GGDEF)-like protein
VARLGGDEFAVLAADAPVDTVDLIRRRVAKSQAERNTEPGRLYDVRMSLGAAAWSPSSPKTLESLLEEADADAYTSKRSRR